MGKILDMFVTIEKTPDEQKNPKQTAPSAAPQATAVSSAPQFTVTPTEAPLSAPIAPQTSDVAHNDAMVEQLEKFVCDHNLPGPDYLELKNHAVTLVDFIPEENAQYKAAFGLLKKQYPELTKEKIVSSIDKYIEMLNSERARGIEQCDNAFKANDMSSKIAEQRGILNNLRQQIDAAKAEYEKKVKSLEDAYNTAQANIAVFEQKNAEITAKHDHDCATFNASVDVVIGLLNDDKQKINNITL